MASVLGKKGDKGAAGKGADEGPADPAPAATAAEEPTGAKLIWIYLRVRPDFHLTI